MSLNEIKNQNRLALRRAVSAGANFGYELNALTLLKNQLDLATAGTLGARASSTVYRAHAAAPTDPMDFVRMMGSTFRAARILLPDIQTVHALAGDGNALDTLIANLTRIFNKKQVGVFFSYAAVMGTMLALAALILRYAQEPKDKKNETRSKKIMRIVRRVLAELMDPALGERLDEHEGSATYKLVRTAMSKIFQFCKRLWNFVKTVFRGDTAQDTVFDVKKFLGVCVSALGLAEQTAQRISDLSVDTRQIRGLPRIHTPINAPLLALDYKPTKSKQDEDEEDGDR